jgi:hypothetical protein
MTKRGSATSRFLITRRIEMRLILILLMFGATVWQSPAATTLVAHSDVWRAHKGTNSPQANWAAAADDSLNAEWSSVPGGIGYGDPAIVGQATVLADMAGAYTTVYMRRTFNVDSAVPASSRMQFTIDYDDAFIAYLDGIEIARSTNAPAGDPDHLAVATSRHEASCCDAPVNPPTVIDLGFVTDRLGSGAHVLAVRGFNDDGASSDFHLIPDLVLLSQNECPGNTICQDAVWKATDGVHTLTTNLTIAPGATLTIQAGAQIRFATNVSLRAGPFAAIDVQGTAEAPVSFAVVGGAGVFGEIAADGTNSFLTIRHAEIAGGAVKFRNGATGVLEDSYIHHFKNGSIPIAGCTAAASVNVRRCHFDGYHETLWQLTPIVIEESLFENADNPSSDALDFDSAPPGSVIRRCTFRNGPQSNTDAIDLGDASVGVVVEDCLMFNFPNDKGVSIGEGSSDIIVRNCLVYGCDSGVAVKDNCTATIYNCTFVGNEFGFRNYNKADPSSATGGGHIMESYNNILWGNTNTISLLNGATAIADHSDFSNITWPGDGIINVDPLFVNAAQRDYRLAATSPVMNAGRNGSSLGVKFPVGAPMAPSHPSLSVEKANSEIRIRFWMDSGKGYILQNKTQLDGTWSNTDLGTVARPKFVEIVRPVGEGPEYFQLVAQP